MAITRTQIAKQLLSKGGRIGLKPGGPPGGGATSMGSGRDFSGPSGPGGGEGNREQRRETQYTKPTNVTKKEFEDRLNRARDFRDTQTVKKAFTTKTLFDKIPSSLKLLSRAIPGNLQYRLDFLKNRPELLEYFNSLTEEEQKSSKLMSALDEIGYGDFLAEEKGAPGLMKAGNVGGLEKFVKEDGTFGYTDVGNRDGADNILLPQGIIAQAPSITDKEDDDEIINYRLMSKGGRAGFRFGSEGYQGGATNQGGAGRGTDVERGGGGDGPKGPPTNVGGDGTTKLKSKKNIPTPNTDISKFNVKDLINLGLVDLEDENTQLAGLNKQQVDFLDTLGKRNKAVGNSDFYTYNTPTQVKDKIESLNSKSTNLFGTFNPEKIVEGDKNTFATDQDVEKYMKDTYQLGTGNNKLGLADGGRIGLMEGGMPYEGGIMDLESARQMYGLGKLVKKVTRGIKKIAKSPIGKAAIIGGLGYFAGGGGNPFTAAGRGKFSLGNLFSLSKNKLLSTNEKFNPFKTFGLTSILPFLTPKEKEKKTLYAGADIDDPKTIMNDPYNYIKRRRI